MSEPAGSPGLLSRPLVPVASEDDAVETCRTAFPRIAAAGGLVFHPRGGSWLLDLLTGDVRDRLIEESGRPVVVLPDPEGDQ